MEAGDSFRCDKTSSAMAAQAQPARASASRRSHESSQGDVDIGSFRRMEEIGRGSFATVYKAMHTVSKHVVLFGVVTTALLQLQMILRETRVLKRA